MLNFFGSEAASDQFASLLDRSRAQTTMKAYAAASLKRTEWAAKHGLQDDGKSFLLYLAFRAGEVGASSLAKEIAAFGFSTGESASPELDIAKLVLQGFPCLSYFKFFYQGLNVKIHRLPSMA